MTQEQLIQEAKREAEKVYPEVDTANFNHVILNSKIHDSREAFIKGYIQQAEKRKSDMLRFAWWVDNNYISYTKWRYIDNKQPENPTLSEEEVYDIYLQQLKQE